MPWRTTGPSSRLIRNTAAPSPTLIPQRLRLIGLVRTLLVDSSDAKPCTVHSHSESTPPTTTASHSRNCNNRRADAKAFALEVQAVEIVNAGPCTPSVAAANGA